MQLIPIALLFLALPVFAATPAEILADMRRAMGADRMTEIAQIELAGTLHVGGMKGRIREVSSTRDVRRASHFDLSVVAGSSGYDGANAWSADAAGLVDLDETPAGKQHAIATSFIANRLFLNPEFAIRAPALRYEGSRAVLTFTPDGGEPLELWIDTETNLVTRTVLPASQESIDWSDYRRVAGLMLPHRVESTDLSNNPTSIIVETYTLSEQLDPALFARPRSRASDTEIAAGSGAMPAHIEGGHVYVEASIDESPPRLFILDTGASVNVLTPEAATALGVDARGNLNATGVGGSQGGVALATVSSVRVGPATLRKQLFAVIPLPALSAVRNGAPEPIAGLLGYDFFRRMRVTVDYSRPAVHLQALQDCGTHTGAVVPMHLDDGRIPRIPLTIAGVEALWTVDTGDAGSLTMSADLARRLAIPEDAGIATMREGGVGGVSRSRVLQLDDVRIGPFVLPDPVIDITEQTSGAFADPKFAGNIGYGTLRRFIVTFDYECRTLGLARSSLFGTPAPYNGAGFTLRQHDEGAWRVLHVMHDSPAAAAGLEQDDVLVSINEVPAASLTRARVGELISGPPGTRIRLQVRRGGDDLHTLTLQLARFIPRFQG